MQQDNNSQKQQTKKRSRNNKINKIFVPINQQKNVDMSLKSDPISYKTWIANGDCFDDIHSSRNALFEILERSQRGCITKSYLIKSLWNLEKPRDDLVCYKSSSTNVMQKFKKTLKKLNSKQDKLLLIADIMYVWISLTSPVTTQVAVDNLEAWIKIAFASPQKKWFTKLGMDYFSKSNPMFWVFMINPHEKIDPCDEDEDNEENDGRKVDADNLNVEIGIVFDTR